MYQCGLDHRIKSDADEQLLGFPASQQKIIRSAKQNYHFLLRLSHSWQDFLNSPQKNEKIQIYKIIKTNSRYNES